MVFPACSDINLKLLLSLADLGTPATLPLNIPKPVPSGDVLSSDDEAEREQARPVWAKGMTGAAVASVTNSRTADEVLRSYTCIYWLHGAHANGHACVDCPGWYCAHSVWLVDACSLITY